jgi:hypothetical protein
MKKKLLYIALVYFFVSTSLFVFSQNQQVDRNLEAIIESVVENLEEGTSVTSIVQDLYELAENRLNINATNNAELSRLYVLDEIQIQNLLQYISEFGPAYSIFELIAIDGFNREVLTKIQPFIQFGEEVKESESLGESLKRGRQEVLVRALGTTQVPDGYLKREDGSVPFEGNRFRYYTRYRFQAGDKISAGFTAEKDPGEAFFGYSNKQGFDYYSGHVSASVNAVFENITVGDFLVRSGQGLVLWQGFAPGKSLNVLEVLKTGQGVKPYTSVDENAFFRGGSATLGFNKGKLNFFYSRKRVDGNIVEENGEIHFSSLQTSGYHRTENEVDDEKSVKDVNAGAIGTLKFRHLKLGTTFLYRKFDLPLIRSDQLYNRFRFTGTENVTGGVDYLFSKGRYQVFGEAAVSKSKGLAFVQGATVHLADQLGFSALYRKFNKNYHALWANAFSESSNTQNENGFYLGIKMLPFKFVRFSAYTDFYRSEWINFTTAGPAKGWDVFTQADFVFSEKFEFYVRLKNEEKEQKFKQNERYVNLPEQTMKTRVHVQFQPKENLVFKTRMEHTFYNGLEKENGFLIFQDVQLLTSELPYSFSARLAWFITESYNSRIYAYENDLLYTFAIPAYFGKGFRTYLNIKYRVSKNLDFWLKAGNTFWSDRETISSGYSEIFGKNKTELKLQLRLKI